MTASVQTMVQQTLSLQLRIRQDPVRSLINDMVATGFYPETEIREWEEVFFSNTGSMSRPDELIFLLTQWVLPAGDLESEDKVRSILNLPKERIDQLIEEHEEAAIQQKIEEEEEERIRTVAIECLQQRAEMAEEMNQRLASQYRTETNRIFELSDSILEMSEARTNQLASLDERISNQKEKLVSSGNQVEVLLGRRKKLQEERKEMLQGAMAGLQ